MAKNKKTRKVTVKKKQAAKRNQGMHRVTRANRKYKDTVFRMLFSDKENLLSLYNAINRSVYENPEDLEIVTASATQLASVVRPALTTIKQPLYDMGAVAMRMLTKLMNNEEVDDTHIVLPYELVKKQSTLNQ